MTRNGGRESGGAPRPGRGTTRDRRTVAAPSLRPACAIGRTQSTTGAAGAPATRCPRCCRLVSPCRFENTKGTNPQADPVPNPQAQRSPPRSAFAFFFDFDARGPGCGADQGGEGGAEPSPIPNMGVWRWIKPLEMRWFLGETNPLTSPYIFVRPILHH